MNVCTEKARIANIEKRLGAGDVTLESINNKLDSMEKISKRIEEQTTKTNGRVNKVERTISAFKNVSVGVVLGGLLIHFGIFEFLAGLL